MCPVQGCGSTFTRSFNLRGHIQSHNTGSLFLCKWPECGKGFTVWDAGRSRAARAPAYVPETLPVMNMKQSSWRPRKGDPCLFNLLVKYKERHVVEVHPEKTSDSDLACCCLIMITPCADSYLAAIAVFCVLSSCRLITLVVRFVAEPSNLHTKH
ncbi:hypothetical protein B0H14DRAFT_2378575 [Mycena olivaceomarginata]|nr:hypothetical protein B0H14DRAFT_2378575 [Mycena olivaceomarginata]